MQTKPFLRTRLIRRWRTFWLWRAGYGFWGRVGSRLASFGIGSYKSQWVLTRMTPKGFISPKAEIVDVDLRLGSCVYIGERVVIARLAGEGFVELGDHVHINRDCLLEIIEGGSISIGAEVALQRGCGLFSAVQPITIGRRAQIAEYCEFHPYDHGMEPGREIFGQPLTSKGPIVVEDDAWLGAGVTVLSGVTIGQGAVIGAGSVVSRSIPAGAIAVGIPARVVKYRGDLRDSGIKIRASSGGE